MSNPLDLTNQEIKDTFQRLVQVDNDILYDGLGNLIAAGGVSGYSGYSGHSGYSGYSGISVSGYSGYSGGTGVGISGYSGFSGSPGGGGTGLFADIMLLMGV